jgi:hypothetical protein
MNVSLLYFQNWFLTVNPFQKCIFSTIFTGKILLRYNEELSSTENCKIIKATPAIILISDFDPVTNVQNFIQWNPIFYQFFVSFHPHNFKIKKIVLQEKIIKL